MTDQPASDRRAERIKHTEGEREGGGAADAGQCEFAVVRSVVADI